MAKRGYKLQEFVAHTTNVNCLSIAKKACRLFITGGDDHKVNLWAIGKPTSLMSLCGHTSPVESLAFNTAEVLVLSGASAGALKLWDLEETKLVRGLTGHRSNCTAVEFHPFGEFFASGSTDTNLKLWDIRKKGCIHTYKGHAGGVSTIRFSPDGRWIVSGGLDNVVKVWDLTAGKHLHDFKFHDGPIRSIDFHPLEFLLATGSADRTVKYWDLETFELIGSLRPEATGVRAITFNPDGQTLFCGLDDCLKVYSWEPVICHDTISMGWSTLGDLCIHEEKLLGGSYYRNTVGIWVADISLMQPYGTVFVPEETDHGEQKLDKQTRHSSDRIGSGARLFRSESPSSETKEIKNIYVDCSGGKTLNSSRAVSLSHPEVIPPLDKTESYNPTAEKQGSINTESWKSEDQAEPKSRREAITFSKTKPGMLLRPAHIRKPSNSKNDFEKLSLAPESLSVNFEKLSPASELVTVKMAHQKINAKDLKLPAEIFSDVSSEKPSSISSVSDKFEKILSPERPSSQTKCNKSSDGVNQIPSVRIVNGVAVVAGRTRTLVEKFERQEKLSSEDQMNPIPQPGPEPESEPELRRTPTTGTKIIPPVVPVPEPAPRRTPAAGTNITPPVVPVPEPEPRRTPTAGTKITPPVVPVPEPASRRTPTAGINMTPPLVPVPEPRRPPTAGTNITPPVVLELSRKPTAGNNITPPFIPDPNRTRTAGTNINPPLLPEQNRTPTVETNVTPPIVPELNRTPTVETYVTPPIVPELNRTPTIETDVTPPIVPELNRTPVVRTNILPPVIRELNDKPVSKKVTHHVVPDTGSTTVTVSELTPSDTTSPISIPTTASRTPPRATVRGTRSSVTSRGNALARVSTATSHASVALATNMISEVHVSGTASTRSSPVNVLNLPTRVPSHVNKPETDWQPSPANIIYHSTTPETDRPAMVTSSLATPTAREFDIRPQIQKEEPQVSGRECISAVHKDVSEDLMQSHDVFLSTLKSRLTKLQVIRHFWERNDMKGAVNALRRLPDHSVQADVISVLLDKMEVINLDLFSFLLPVLVGLLDSKTERHSSLSLELLLKLVAVFGPVIRSTISARPTVGVDLHAEQRRECCNQCHKQLQKIRQLLPTLSRRGGLLARSALELNLVLQDS